VLNPVVPAHSFGCNRYHLETQVLLNQQLLRRFSLCLAERALAKAQSWEGTLLQAVQLQRWSRGPFGLGSSGSMRLLIEPELDERAEKQLKIKVLGMLRL